MTAKKILIVDDEKEIRELIDYNLKRDGYETLHAKDGEEALLKVKTNLPDLVILDIMLPGLDGLEVLKQIRSNDRTSAVSVIMLSAKGEETDVVLGLELGASDYISKPFSVRILLARVKAVLRSKQLANDEDQENLQLHGIQINTGRHEVIIDGKQIILTLSEFNLLRLFASKPGWVFTRNQLVDSLRGENTAITERAIDVVIVGLRKKISDKGNLIETVRGIGYRIKD